MDMSQQIFWQEEIERKYNRKHIDGYIRDAIEAQPEMVARVEQGIALVETFRTTTFSYQSKNDRIRQLANLDLRQLVMDLFVGIAYCQRETLLPSVAAMLASRLKFNDKVEAITTVAEIMAVLCATDAFDINKASRNASLMVISKIPLSTELREFIDNSQYLPPMVCKPLELQNNYSSGYLTHNESLVLGSGNHHDGDLCLDVLNTMNGVQLKLAVDFLSTVEEQPTFDIETQDQQDNWTAFKKQSYRFYKLMADKGNRFYLTHRVDKRGRIYCSGYHISSQGAAFKKAAIELAHEELIEVPDEYRV